MKITVEFDNLDEFKKYFESAKLPKQPTAKIPEMLKPESATTPPPSTVLVSRTTPIPVQRSGWKQPKHSWSSLTSNFAELEILLAELHEAFGDSAVTGDSIMRIIERKGRLKSFFDEACSTHQKAVLLGRLFGAYISFASQGKSTKFVISKNFVDSRSRSGNQSKRTTYSISPNQNERIQLPNRGVGRISKEWLELLDLYINDRESFSIDDIISSSGTSEDRFAFMNHLNNHPALTKVGDLYVVL